MSKKSYYKKVKRKRTVHNKIIGFLFIIAIVFSFLYGYFYLFNPDRIRADNEKIQVYFKVFYGSEENKTIVNESMEWRIYTGEFNSLVLQEIGWLSNDTVFLHNFYHIGEIIYLQGIFWDRSSTEKGWCLTSLYTVRVPLYPYIHLGFPAPPIPDRYFYGCLTIIYLPMELMLW